MSKLSTLFLIYDVLFFIRIFVLYLIFSNLANKIGLKLKTETLTCSAGIIRNYTFPNLPTHNFSFPIISSCSLNYEGVAVGRNVIEDGSIWVYSPVSQDIIVYLVVFT